MKNRVLALLLAAALLAGLLAACTPTEVYDDTAYDDYDEPVPPIDTIPDDGTAHEDPLPGDGESALAAGSLPGETRDAILAFSRALFREVLALEDDNPVLSPLSAYYALAMVALGARGETEAEFAALLGRDPAELARDLQALTEALTRTAGSTNLNIAGGVWTAADFAIEPAFSAMLEQYFGAPAYSRDFRDPATLDEINGWIYAQTEGLIEEMISSIGRDTVMLLANTLYFSAKWAEAFGPMRAYPGLFYTASGETAEMPFLSTRAGAFSVARTDAFEAVSLPYDDERLAFLLVRPTDGLPVREFAAEFALDTVLDALEMREEVQVRMPKLDLEFEVLLNEVLDVLGLGLAFSDRADFSGLSAEEEALRISSVLQKVRLLVDEEGTEAAAVTVVEIERTSIALDLLELRFDSPYLYVIYDVYTGIPLFMGIFEEV